MSMRFFLAGIMQGSHLGEVLHSQDYRSRLKTLIAEHFPGASVYDPLADHRQSLAYDDATARDVFLHHNRMCAEEVDVVIAYVPEASMGTAIEMWEAHQSGRAVVAVSPLKHNWVIKFCSCCVYADIEALEAEIASGKLAQRLTNYMSPA